jgi:hypothetical protein
VRVLLQLEVELEDTLVDCLEAILGLFHEIRKVGGAKIFHLPALVSGHLNHTKVLVRPCVADLISNACIAVP